MKYVIYITLVFKMFFLSSLNLFAQVNLKSNNSHNPDSTGKLNKKQKDTVVFLLLTIKEDSTLGKNVVELVKMIKKAGKIKYNSVSRNNSQNYLTVDVFDGQEFSEQLVIEHPLYRIVESVDNNGMFYSRLIQSQKAEFIIRINVPDNSSIIISETVIDKDKIKTPLINIKL